MLSKRSDRPGGEAEPKMRYSGTILHDFRRSFVRNIVESGVREKDAMLISGHKTRSVFDRYNIRSSEDVRPAADKLDAYLEKDSHISAIVEGPVASGKSKLN